MERYQEIADALDSVASMLEAGADGQQVANHVRKVLYDYDGKHDIPFEGGIVALAENALPRTGPADLQNTDPEELRTYLKTACKLVGQLRVGPAFRRGGPSCHPPADAHLRLRVISTWLRNRLLPEADTSEAAAPKAAPKTPAAGPSEPQTAADNSPWATAASLWRPRFTTYKQLTKFRKKHPEMFRNNQSGNKLLIHAGKWLTFWAARDKADFKSLDGELPSIADDPNFQDEALMGVMQRLAAARAKKHAEKQ